MLIGLKNTIQPKKTTIGSLRNSRSSKKTIRTSHIILGILGCIFIGAVILFGSSLHYILSSNSASSANISNENNNAETSNNIKKQKLRGGGGPIPISLQAAQEAIQQIKYEFYERYGGQTMAEEMFEKTITTFGRASSSSSAAASASASAATSASAAIDATAERILKSIVQQQSFVMGFAGYSITVGRGNFFNQSFPFVVERVLQKSMKAIGVPNFIVRNSAIGGIPSFPYAYCLDHFVSRESDILSWDFSMNEKAKDPAVFEAYIRQALHQLPKRPMIIMIDNNQMRTNLLEDYVKAGLLEGALTVAKADTVISSDLLQKPDNQKPRGLQQWDEFGAPAGCPGKGSWHPKMKEHEFMGWMIAMHFVKALEKAYDVQKENPHSWQSKYKQVESKAMVVFPDPISSPPDNDQSVTEILFGHKINDNQYQMKELSCRTNFLPATDYDKILQSLVVSGISNRATAANIMDPRPDDIYQEGWVLDVSEVERDTKRKVEKCGGLGYIDMKIALYGVPESGTLELFLPYEAKPHDHSHDMSSTEHKEAKHWFDGLIICEANDKRPNEACQLDRDVEYVVGGIHVPSVAMVNGAGEYLKRKTCVNVGVPADAEISRRNIIGTNGSTSDSVGLQVKIAAKNKINRKDGACCISHVVWEQH